MLSTLPLRSCLFELSNKGLARWLSEIRGGRARLSRGRAERPATQRR